VFDSFGKVVETRQGSGQVSHQFSNISEGIYFVNLTTAAGVYTAKAAHF
jgi:hypothetical protein